MKAFLKTVFSAITLPVLRFFSNLLENYFIRKKQEKDTRRDVELESKKRALSDVKKAQKVSHSVDDMSDTDVYSELYNRKRDNNN